MASSSCQSITLIYSPYHVGIHNQAVGAGPFQIKDQGLVSSLRGLGVTVHECEIEPVDDFEGDIGRSFEIYRRTSKLVTAARDTGSFPIVVSGNCGATVGVHAGLNGSKRVDQNEIGCIWFDAHDDFNVPDTMTSGYFDSQPVAIMAGQCWRALVETVPGYTPLNLNKLLHVGLRDLNDLELERVKNAGYPVIWGNAGEVNYPEVLSDALSQRTADATMVHVDLDCLSAKVGQVNKYKPEPGGLSEDDLYRCMESVPAKVRPLSLTIASYDPAYDEEVKIGAIAVRAISAFVRAMLRAGLLAATR